MANLTKKHQTRKKSKKSETKKLDDLWRDAIYDQGNNQCEYCGSPNKNAHHIFSRSNYATRWDVKNGVCLCPKHHVLGSEFSAHKTPVEFIEWIRAKRGETWYNDLRISAKSTVEIELSKADAFLRLTKII